MRRDSNFSGPCPSHCWNGRGILLEARFGEQETEETRNDGKREPIKALGRRGYILSFFFSPFPVSSFPARRGSGSNRMSARI
jgi:hypothetical protein